MREPFSRVYCGSPATYFLSPPVMSKNFTWISLSLSGCGEEGDVLDVPVARSSPFSSVGQILSVLFFCSAADERALATRTASACGSW